MENIEKELDKAGKISNKVTKFILIVMTSVATIIAAWYGLKEDVQEKKTITVEQIDSIIVATDTLKIDTNEIK